MGRSGRAQQDRPHQDASATGCSTSCVLNAFEMSAANMDAYLEAVQAFRPKLHLRLRQQRRAAGGARERARGPPAPAGTARRLHDGRAAVPASADS